MEISYCKFRTTSNNCLCAREDSEQGNAMYPCPGAPQHSWRAQEWYLNHVTLVWKRRLYWTTPGRACDGCMMPKHQVWGTGKLGSRIWHVECWTKMSAGFSCGWSSHVPRPGGVCPCLEQHLKELGGDGTVKSQPSTVLKPPLVHIALVAVI